MPKYRVTTTTLRRRVYEIDLPGPEPVWNAHFTRDLPLLLSRGELVDEQHLAEDLTSVVDLSTGKEAT